MVGDDTRGKKALSLETNTIVTGLDRVIFSGAGNWMVTGWASCNMFFGKKNRVGTVGT